VALGQSCSFIRPEGPKFGGLRMREFLC
jgi:hypothetical protein